MEIRRKYLDSHREQLMLNYFLKVKAIAGVVLAVAAVVLLVLCGFTTKYRVAHLCLGSASFLIMLSSVLCFIGGFSRKLSDEDAIKLIDDDDKLAFADTFATLAIENNKNNFIAPSIEFSSPAFGKGKKTLFFRYAKKANRLLFSAGTDITFLFGQKTLFVHSYYINHITGIRAEEKAVEVEYKDIVTIATDIEITSGLKRVETVTLTIGLVNGQNISVVLRSIPMHGQQPQPLTDREREIVSILRTSIRNNK